MNTKQKIVLTIVAIFGLVIIMLYVPKVVKVNYAEPVVEETNAYSYDKCPVCGVSFIYGDGFTRLYIAEYDEAGGRIAPFRKLPAMACNNCGVVRLDLKRISNQPKLPMEALDMRPQE